MSDYNNSQQNNQRSSNQDWNNDPGQERHRNHHENNRNDNNERGNQRSGTYGFNNENDRNAGNNWQNQRQDFPRNEKWNNDNNINGSYGSDTGPLQGRQDTWESGRNHSIYNNDHDFGNNRNSSRQGSGNGGFNGNDGNNYNDRNRNQQHDRGWWDKTRDEVSSWFGDNQAERRHKQENNKQQGPHRGKGPKGYTRSDERIMEDINDRLTDDQHIDATDIIVNITNGEVVLTGSVDSRQTKRYTEDLVEAVSGVRNVENRLRASMENRNSSQSQDSFQGNKGFTGNSNTGTDEKNKS